MTVASASEHEEVRPSTLPDLSEPSHSNFNSAPGLQGRTGWGVAGDLRFAIVKKLQDAGIEIPFPQRDLHIRTADSDAASSAGLKKQAVAPAGDGAVGLDAHDREENKKS